MNKEVSVYDPVKHVGQLLQWFDQWKIPHQILDTLPTTGLIVEGGGAIFMYETNSNMCFVECFIVNKELARQDKEEVLDALGDVSIHLMKEKGFKYMATYTRHQAVVDRAKKHGYHVNEHNYQCICRSLV